MDIIRTAYYIHGLDLSHLRGDHSGLPDDLLPDHSHGVHMWYPPWQCYSAYQLRLAISLYEIGSGRFSIGLLRLKPPPHTHNDRVIIPTKSASRPWAMFIKCLLQRVSFKGVARNLFWEGINFDQSTLSQWQRLLLKISYNAPIG